jgi:hypothetical protein
MPDICMCAGDSCPKKRECYRYRAVPTPRRQSYFMSPPVKADGSCEHFLSLRKGDVLADGDQG